MANIKVADIFDALDKRAGNADVIFFDANDPQQVIWEGQMGDCPFEVWRRELVQYIVGGGDCPPSVLREVGMQVMRLGKAALPRPLAAGTGPRRAGKPAGNVIYSHRRCTNYRRS